MSGLVAEHLVLAFLVTAARDTIDKDWVKQVRKTWKTLAGRVTSAGYMDVPKRLQELADWVLALANDMAYAKGFFTFLREDKKEHTIIYKLKLKAMEHLKETIKLLREYKREVEWWDKTLTPGTREWKMGVGHRWTAIKEVALKSGFTSEDVVSPEATDELLKDEPQLAEKFLSRQTKLLVAEGMAKAESEFSRKFLAHLTRIMNKWQSDIEWGSYEREFSIGNVKVVMVDLPHPFAQKPGQGKEPSQVGEYIRQLQKAEALLKAKGLGFLWYGTMFVSCKDCGGENELGKHFGVGARYHSGKDVVTIFQKPTGGLYRLIAHELGHRYYYKFMSSSDRARFDSWFGDVPAVSEYGGTISEEDFAEVFSYYIDNRNLTRDQLERFKQFIKTKGKRANDKVEEEQPCLAA